MPHFDLYRQSDDGHSTLGRLWCHGINRREYLNTLERPWLPNPEGPGGMQRLSCVPPGEYELIPHESMKYPKSFALVNDRLGVFHQHPNVGKWGRTAILIHAGNTVADVIGCIALGMEVNLQSRALLRSRIAVDKFRLWYGDRNLRGTLTIHGPAK